jgi:FdhD protein
MDEVDTIALPPDARLDQETLYAIVDTIRLQQSVYKQAGSVHGCALFRGSELLTFVEDVGRHNAVDAIAGWMWLEDMSGADKIFYTTGRLTSEMVIKGAQMGIPFLLSRSGVTQMGYQMAKRVGMTLFARCTGKHFLLYTARAVPPHTDRSAGAGGQERAARHQIATEAGTRAPEAIGCTMRPNPAAARRPTFPPTPL